VRLHKFLFGEIRLSSFSKRVTSKCIAPQTNLLHQQPAYDVVKAMGTLWARQRFSAALVPASLESETSPLKTCCTAARQANTNHPLQGLPEFHPIKPCWSNHGLVKAPSQTPSESKICGHYRVPFARKKPHLTAVFFRQIDTSPSP
jgi:hypothetical protein